MILGGTSEARLLAGSLVKEDRWNVITSLAGRTADPAPVAGEIRTGGFGGAGGLTRYIAETGVDFLVDATHPFASRISANAVAACGNADIPGLRLERAPWRPLPGDDWNVVADIAAAAAAIPGGARAFVTVGRQEIAPFLQRADIAVIARMIERPEVDLPANAEIVLARPPFTLDSERAFLVDRKVGVLVAKNSGGKATAAKLAAARELHLPVIMVARPQKPPMRTVSTVNEALGLIAGQLP